MQTQTLKRSASWKLTFKQLVSND